MTLLRLCLSGSPSCSGVVPCQACHMKIASDVIPKAIMAANLNADQATAERFFLAYGDAWRAMLTTLPMPEAPPTLNGAESNVARGGPMSRTVREEVSIEEADDAWPPCGSCGKPVVGHVPAVDPDGKPLEGAIPMCSLECAKAHAARGEEPATEAQEPTPPPKRKRPRRSAPTEPAPPEPEKESKP